MGRLKSCPSFAARLSRSNRCDRCQRERRLSGHDRHGLHVGRNRLSPLRLVLVRRSASLLVLFDDVALAMSSFGTAIRYGRFPTTPASRSIASIGCCGLIRTTASRDTDSAIGVRGVGAVTVVCVMSVAAQMSVVPRVPPDPFLANLRLSYAVWKG